MKIRKVLLVSKQSAYTFYFLNNDVTGGREITRVIHEDRKRFEEAHQLHYATLEHVKTVLNQYQIPFQVTYRGRQVDYQNFDFVITVGGDGTFLEAARHLDQQIILGVNSAPSYSVGRFCAADQSNFENLLARILDGQAAIHRFQRLEVEIDAKTYPVRALNDLLICHRNPAFLCRYYLKVGNLAEEQRSSGLWISTPAGSSGALRSSGGSPMNIFDKKFQYRPRELYHQKTRPGQLIGGVLSARQTLQCVSLMRNGMIYLDGAHHHVSFGYGASARVRLSSEPVRTIGIPE